MVVEEDLRDRLGRSREEARRSLKAEEGERSSRMRRRSSEDNGMKMDLGMIVKTVVRDERELKEMHDDYERRLTTMAERHRVELERLRIELTGSAEESLRRRRGSDS